MMDPIITRVEHDLVKGLRRRVEWHFCKYDEDGESLCEECSYTYPDCLCMHLLKVENELENHIKEEGEWQEPGTPRREP